MNKIGKRILCILCIVFTSVVILTGCNHSSDNSDDIGSAENIVNIENEAAVEENSITENEVVIEDNNLKNNTDKTEPENDIENNEQDTVTLPLVTDAYSDSFEAFDETYYQIIPQINLPNDVVAEVNTQIKEEVLSSLEESGMADSTQVAYIWTENNNVVSVLVESFNVHSSLIWYHVYNVSIETGELIQDNILIDMYGLSMTEFYNLVKDRLNEFHEEQAEIVGEDNLFLQEQWGRSVADENVQGAAPYINENGDVCAVVKTYSIAGADYYYNLFNITGDEEPVGVFE